MMIRMYSKNDLASKNSEEIVKHIKKIWRDINKIKYDYEEMDPTNYVKKSVLFDDLDLLVDELFDRKQEHLIPVSVKNEREYRNIIPTFTEIELNMLLNNNIEDYHLTIEGKDIVIEKTISKLGQNKEKSKFLVKKCNFLECIRFIHFYDWKENYFMSLMSSLECWSFVISYPPKGRDCYIGSNCYPVGFHHLVNMLRNHTI